jgi:hypothetical protein
MSPSEEEIPPPVKVLNVNLAKNNMVLPVHQGRNPTVERNTHKKSDEELSVAGNKLVYNNERCEDEEGGQPPLLDDLIHSFNDSLETSLVQNDVLGQHRNPPIPYLQNQVHDSHGGRPKVANIPQAIHNSEQEKSHQSRFKNLVKVKDIGSKLPFFKKKGRHAQKKISKTGQDNASEISNLLQDQEQNPNFSQVDPSQSSTTWYNPGHERSPSPVQTEIRMMNGRPTVQPSAQKQSNIIYMAEIGKAKKETPGPRSAVMVTKSGGHSKSASDISPHRETRPFSSSVTELDDVFSKTRRPNSLSLRGHNYKLKSPPKSNTCESFAILVKDSEKDRKIQKDDSSEKIKKRVKTPVTLSQGRLSLYDDRLMTHYILETPEFAQKPVKEYRLLADDVNANLVITNEQSC